MGDIPVGLLQAKAMQYANKARDCNERQQHLRIFYESEANYYQTRADLERKRESNFVEWATA